MPRHRSVTALLFMASCSHKSEDPARASSSTRTSETTSTGSRASIRVHRVCHMEESSRSTRRTTVQSMPAVRPITQFCFHMSSGSI